MKKFVILVLIISVLLLGATAPGCGKKKTVFDTSSLQVSFVENAPPKEINYGETFPIYVEVKNIGGYDVPVGGANFYLVGIGENIINVQKKLTNTGTLTKRTPMQQGGSEILSFATAARISQPFYRPFNITMKVVSCYNYVTIAQTNICIGKKDCSPDLPLAGNKIVTGSNTAGPIQVTELTEQVMGNKLYVSFRIQNKGRGEVYLPDTDCDKLEAQDMSEQLKKNRIAISVRTDQGFLCNLQSLRQPYTTIQALEGSTQEGYTVTCEKTLVSPESYGSAIEITLSYKYRESVAKTITILP